MEEGTRSPPLSVSPIQAIGNIVISGRAAKRTKTLKPVETSPSPSVDKKKRAVENLSSAPDNELLNTTEVGANCTPVSITEMLYSKVFGGILDVSDPYFLACVSNLAYTTKLHLPAARAT